MENKLILKDPELKSRVRDICFDTLGHRIALVTEDRQIRVYAEKEGVWELYVSCENAHSKPIIKIKWAHPKFGPFLATCELIRLHEQTDRDMGGAKGAFEIDADSQQVPAIR